jgi:hypothetical protein
MSRVHSSPKQMFILIAISLVMFSGCTQTFSTSVDTEQKINEFDGNFNGVLADNDRFGFSIANIGDLEGDGVIDLAVGEPFDDDGGTDRGAIWILFLDDNGQVDLEQKISSSDGNFSGTLDNADRFGSSVASVGDLNNDGTTDIVVGAPGDDEDGTDRGAIWVLFMNSDGRVQSERKIANGLSGFGDVLDNNDQFGSAVASIGDLNNDGITDLVVGEPFDDDGGTDFGAVWILFMNNDGTVAARQKISFDEGGFAGGLFTNDQFGFSVGSLGDIDGDGVTDLIVGAPGDDDGGTDRGAVWILNMNSDGTVKSEQKISQGFGEFDGAIGDGDGFGNAVSNLGDYNSDGVPEIGVAAKLNDDGGSDRGAFWVIFLKSNGEVISSSKISDLQGGFSGVLADGDQLATGLVSLGDLDNDGVNDIAATASGDSVNGANRGAIWVLFMKPVEPGVDVDEDWNLATLFGGG